MTFSFTQHARFKAATFKTAAIALTTVTATFAALSEAAQAVSLSFNFTGATQSWTVPKSGIYTINAFGAQGGVGAGLTGGFGGQTGANFNLTQGQILSILVGGRGGNFAEGFGGGGGGGSFVVNSNTNTPLVVAGGGGGSGGAGGFGGAGLGGSAGTFTPGAGTGGGVGTGFYIGGGGGGFSSSGANGRSNGGKSFIEGGQGGFTGGFGGGGGASVSGGGGGGFNGGTGGDALPSGTTGGTGGAGFVNSTLVSDPALMVFLDGVQAGNGLVTIAEASEVIPTPALLPGVIAAGIGMVKKRKQQSDSANAEPDTAET